MKLSLSSSSFSEFSSKNQNNNNEDDELRWHHKHDICLEAKLIQFWVHSSYFRARPIHSLITYFALCLFALFWTLPLLLFSSPPLSHYMARLKHKNCMQRIHNIITAIKMFDCKFYWYMVAAVSSLPLSMMSLTCFLSCIKTKL